MRAMTAGRRSASVLFGMRELARLLRRYRHLVFELARRDITEQYAGQMFGALWAIGHPLFMMALYLFIFGFVFKTKIGGTVELPLDYTTYLLSGLIPWLGCQQSMSRNCAILVGHANLVKQVVFPIEVLPIKAVLSSLVPEIVGLIVLTIYVTVRNTVPPATYLLLPLLLALQICGLIGLGFVLAVVGAFMRDLKDFIQIFALAGVYLMPVFYLPTWVPGAFKPFLYLNPFSYVTWCFQDALFFGRFEHPWAWLVFAGGSIFLLLYGYAFFNRLKSHLGSVL